MALVGADGAVAQVQQPPAALAHRDVSGGGRPRPSPKAVEQAGDHLLLGADHDGLRARGGPAYARQLRLLVAREPWPGETGLPAGPATPLDAANGANVCVQAGEVRR